MSIESNESAAEWRWGAVRFEGLFGLHGDFLCFHRPADGEGVLVDPAKPVFPLQIPEGGTLPDFVAGGAAGRSR